MTEEQRGELEELIRQKMEQIVASMPYLEEETKAIAPSVSLGRLTRMEALNDKGVNEHVLEQNRRQLQRLANALKRVGTDDYGRCIRCGEEIPIERLRVVPEALVCVPCAENKRG